MRIFSIREGQEIIGIAPLMQNGKNLSFLGDTDLFDYHDFLVKKGKEEQFYEALCNHLMDIDWVSLDLRSLLQNSPTLEHLPLLLEGKGLKIEISEEDKAPVAVLPATWDDYLAGLKKKDRHELRRKLRRLEANEGVCQYTVGDSGDVNEAMKDFFTLMKASRTDKEEFMTPEREDFFVDIVNQFAPKGQVKLHFLEVHNIRVASCICFDYADAYLLYNSGYDTSYSELSIGLINKALCLKEAIENKRYKFDFLRGTERYKYDLGGKDQTIYQLIASR